MFEQLQKHKTTILVSLVTSGLVFLVLVGLFALLIASNQGAVYKYFSGQFTRAFGAPITLSNETLEQLTAQEALVINAVSRATPAVFSIVAEKTVTAQTNDPFDLFFERFFGRPAPQEEPEERRVGGGSGFVISSDGLAVTNRHVVDDEDARYTAVTQDGAEHALSIVAKDPILDIAVVQIDAPPDVSPLSFGNSDTLQVGQSVIAIGNALAEFQNSVSLGIISGLKRSIIAGSLFGSSEILDEVIQTDAAINPGNSGGPLLNLRGEVVGVNVAIAQGSENIGFALPSNIVREVVESVQQTGGIVRPLLGVRFVHITPSLATLRGLPVEHGALIIADEGLDAVLPDSSADEAGLREGDIILSVDSVEISGRKTLTGEIRKKRVADEILLEIQRGDEVFTTTAILKSAPDDL